MGLSQQRRRLLHRPAVALHPVRHRPVAFRRLHRPVQRLPVNQVPGNVQQHRPPLAGQGGAKGVVEHFRDALGLVHLEGQLGGGLENGYQVKLLGAVPVGIVLGGVAGDDNYRGAALVGQGNAGSQVDGAGAGGGNAGGGLARGPGVAVGHKSGPLFVAGINKPDVVPTVKLGNDAVGSGADQPEDMVNALGPQRFHNCPAGHHLRHLFRSPLLVVLAVFIGVSVDLPGVL